MPDQCDHTVAHGYEDDWCRFVRVSGMEKIASDVIKKNLEWANGSGCKALRDRIKSFTNAYQHFEQTLEIFNYCPDCGEKIDWELLKSMKIDRSGGFHSFKIRKIVEVIGADGVVANAEYKETWCLNKRDAIRS